MKTEIPKHKLQIYIFLSNLSDAGSELQLPWKKESTTEKIGNHCKYVRAN